MPLQISRVVQFFQRCGEILKTKSELYYCFSLFGQNQQSYHQREQQNSLIIIQNCFQKFLSFWMQQMIIYQSYHPIHLNSSNMLFSKANKFKNKTQLLSKQEQLTVQLTQIIDDFKNSTDPVSYYTLNKRIKIKQSIIQKLIKIKHFSAKTSQTYRPMFPHLFQKQMKQSFYQVYVKQAETDTINMQNTERLYQKIIHQCQKIKFYLKQSFSQQVLTQYKNKFYQENYNILSQKGNVKQQQLTKYCYNINKIAKNFNNFWNCQTKSLQIFIKQIQRYKLILNKIKDDSNTIVNKFYQQNVQISNQIWKLFRVYKIFNLIKVLDKNLFLIQILSKFIAKLNKQKQFILKIQKQNNQFLHNISKNLSQRTKNFHIYLLEDKKYLQQQCKFQKYFGQTISQLFYDFFQDCLQLLKQINQLMIVQSIQKLQLHQVSSIITKILTQDDQESPTKFKQSPHNSRIISSNNQRNQKIKGFQNFIQSLVIFNDQQAQNHEYITSALGPRLLLHGRIYALEKGIYFQSVFNKKNLFFGKTKLFIPKQDILQINQTNALFIFPDIVQITTNHGPINIHALGSRQRIFNCLTSQYFPQYIRSDVQGYSQKDFNQCNNIQIDNIDLQQKKPLETLLQSKIFPGCKLNKFFRRYLSDDQFQNKGKVYDTFKSFFLTTVVEGIDPKGTSLTPQPPLYFQYSNQKKSQTQVPRKSQRIYTYGKVVPTIPFIVKGGQGLGQDRQTFNWISPKILIVQSQSVIKGFSLTESMIVRCKTLCQELDNGLKFQLSSSVSFTDTSSTNSLLKGPTNINLKSSIRKMVEIIEKYEKGKGGGKKVKGSKGQNIESQSLKCQVEILQKQNQQLKRNIKIGLINFVVIYIISIMIILYLI